MFKTLVHPPLFKEKNIEESFSIPKSCKVESSSSEIVLNLKAKIGIQMGFLLFSLFVTSVHDLFGLYRLINKFPSTIFKVFPSSNS